MPESYTGEMMHSFSKAEIEKLEALSDKLIFFGHRSVGDNIINGIKLLQESTSEIKLNTANLLDYLLDKKQFVHSTSPSFLHSEIGKNGAPLEKTQKFAAILNTEEGQKIDIAFHKYCYVDITHQTNVEELFDNYRKEMKKVENKHPDTTFIHFTVPLTTVQSGVKAKIKKIIGKPLGGYEANINRNRFNALLKEHYLESHHLFDLAQYEATAPDGNLCTFRFSGRDFMHLCEQYTYDGGHLNKQGQIFIADKFLKFLATL